MESIISRYIWVAFLILSAINYFIAERRIRRTSSPGSPELSDEARHYRLRFAWVSEVPWLVMGLGILAGGVPHLWSFLEPGAWNPYVWAWYLTVFAIVCLFSVWALFKGGARRMIELKLIHGTGLGRGRPTTEFQLKLLAAATPFLFILWLWMLYYMERNQQ